MNKISIDEIKKLSESKATAPAVTIYLPTHKASTPPNMTEDQIRFKNLASKASEILDSSDKHNPFNKEFQDICNSLIEDRNFWEHMSESMLICVRPGMMKYFHLPIDCEEYVAVSDHFHLAGVLGLVKDLKEYYVLSIAQHNPLLFEGDAYGLAKSVVELPESLMSALNIDEMHQKSVQFASVKSPKGAEYHGHGGGKDTGDAERQRYLKILDDIVVKNIDTSKPLVLAGIDLEISEYKSHSRHPVVVDGHVDGIFTDHDLAKLHEKSLALIRAKVVEPEHRQAKEKYERLHGRAPERTAETISELKDAAEKGRVGTLLVGMMKVTRDTVRDNSDQVNKLVFPDENESLALDYISRQVANQSGEVVGLPQNEMPGSKLMVAINRY